MTQNQCYTDDWQRTDPDYVVYLPVQPGGRDEVAQEEFTVSSETLGREGLNVRLNPRSAKLYTYVTQ